MTPDEQVEWCRAHAGRMVKSKTEARKGRLVAVYVRSNGRHGSAYTRGRPLIEGSYGTVQPASAWEPDMECLVPGGARGGFSVPFEDLELIDGPTAAVAKAAPTDNRYPHTCTRCGAPAYVGFAVVDCSKRCILKPKGAL